MYDSLTQTPDDSVSDHGKITRIELGHVRLRHAEEQARNYVIRWMYISLTQTPDDSVSDHGKDMFVYGMPKSRRATMSSPLTSRYST